jgi:DNA repair protein RadA/Sms
MLGSGLREVSNPSEILISHKDEELSGTAIASTLEGMRPLMIEIPLVSTAFTEPSTQHDGLQRQETQYEPFWKKGRFQAWRQRRFQHGGISVDDPAIDLAVVAAILSSNEDTP